MRKGCGCKTGCQSSRCKCKRTGNYCYGCKCVGCYNLPSPTHGQVTESPPSELLLSSPSDSVSEGDESDDEPYERLEENIETTMQQVLVTMIFRVSVTMTL